MYAPQSIVTLNWLLEQLPADVQAMADRRFLTRLAANFNHLHGLYTALYGQKGQAHLPELLSTMLAYYNNRPEALKVSDQQREAVPDWLLNPEQVGYVLYTDKFAKDLKGVRKQLDYLQELGATLVHLMPFLQSPWPENDGGYAVNDYLKVDAHYGTNKQLKGLIGDLKARNMLLVMDLVLNHTADDHAWAEAAKAGDAEKQGYYYFFNDRTLPDQYEQSMPEVFPLTAPGNFTEVDELNQWVMTVFHHYQWDLNYRNPKVFIEMLGTLLHWANEGVDVFRLDAVAFMWKRLGTQCQNEPEVHTILQLFKACCQVAAPGVAFIAEAIVQPNEIIKYMGEGKAAECDMAYNATFMALLWDALATKNTRLLTTSLNNIPQKPLGTTWLNYVRCHDDIGLGYADEHIAWAGYSPGPHRDFLVQFYTGKFEGTWAMGMPYMSNPKTGDARISGSLASLAGLEKAVKDGNDPDAATAVARINLLHSLILSFCGLPMIYYGDELATLNDYESWRNQPNEQDNRWIHRPDLDARQMGQRNKKGTYAAQVFGTLKHLIALRKQLPALKDVNNQQLLPLDNQHVFGFVRSLNGQHLVVLCNFNVHPEMVQLANVLSPWLDAAQPIHNLVTNKPLTLNGGFLLLQPYEYLWLQPAGLQ